MTLIVDASFSGAWVLPDESSAKAERLLKRILEGADTLSIPNLWFYEMTNLLIVAERRGRIDKEQILTALELLVSVPKQRFDHQEKLVLERTAQFAHRFNLSAYDAAYVELADRLQAPIHSLDEKIHKAAADLGLLAP